MRGYVQRRDVIHDRGRGEAASLAGRASGQHRVARRAPCVIVSAGRRGRPSARAFPCRAPFGRGRLMRGAKEGRAGVLSHRARLARGRARARASTRAGRGPGAGARQDGQRRASGGGRAGARGRPARVGAGEGQGPACGLPGASWRGGRGGPARCISSSPVHLVRPVHLVQRRQEAARAGPGRGGHAGAGPGAGPHQAGARRAGRASLAAEDQPARSSASRARRSASAGSGDASRASMSAEGS